MHSPPNTSENTQLVVFSDDFGRHPSSCQHLISHLLDKYPTLWVNTIGTRAPGLSAEDLCKAATKLKQWLIGDKQPAHNTKQHNLSVLTPVMYPGFRSSWQRKLNACLIAKRVNKSLAQNPTPQKRIAITTIPITADLVGKLNVDRWIYYCVDDFSLWPGLDSRVMDDMERKLVKQVDAIVVVSQTLQNRIASMGRSADIITHGIDLSHWQLSPQQQLPNWWPTTDKPIFLFWGVVDKRLDVALCQTLATKCGVLILLGPQQSPDPRLQKTPNIIMPGPAPYQQLPTLAQAADILVMPYDDLPVTRAIQPLKFKEYLATGKPVISRRLPATEPWHDAADLVDSADQLIEAVTTRLTQSLPDSQKQARRQLTRESWQHKAAQLEKTFLSQ